MPLVSVVIPTYNRAKLISRAVDSVLKQSFTDFELLIVNDGSKDNTTEVVGLYTDTRIRYINRAVNNGQNFSRNEGVLAAQGEYITFLDSDDEWLPSYLEKMVDVLQKDHSVGAVYARAFGCSATGVLTEGYSFHLEGDIYKEVLEQGYLSYMITIMVRKTIIGLLEPMPFDPSFSYGDDDDFCFRVAKNGKIALIKEPLAIIHNDGATVQNEASICLNLELIAVGREKLIQKYKDDILRLCGRAVLAGKYFTLGEVLLRAGNFTKAHDAFRESYSLAPSLRTLAYLSYAGLPVVRFPVDIARRIYRSLKRAVPVK